MGGRDTTQVSSLHQAIESVCTSEILPAGKKVLVFMMWRDVFDVLGIAAFQKPLISGRGRERRMSETSRASRVEDVEFGPHSAFPRIPELGSPTDPAFKNEVVG